MSTSRACSQMQPPGPHQEPRCLYGKRLPPISGPGLLQVPVQNPNLENIVLEAKSSGMSFKTCHDLSSL